MSGKKLYIGCLILILALGACAPATANITKATPLPSATSAAPAAPPANPTQAAFSDPFAYCAAIGTIDAPDGHYTGEKMPPAIVQGLKKASGAAADVPDEVFANGSTWRCVDGEVYACFVGANLPCDAKANLNKTPSPAENDYCKANPDSDFIPAAVTGHETIYAWACKSGAPVIDKQVFQVDAQGYIKEIWYPIPQP